MKNIYSRSEIFFKAIRFLKPYSFLLLFFAQNSFAQSLKLPFFDDFSTTKTSQPNTKLWKNGGVNINNTFAVGQPSMVVATFDGRNSAGIPYDFSNQTAYGYADSLTSQPIDLAGLKTTDGVFLSFYWQAKGIGELPDKEDSLTLSFLDKKGNWRTVWGQNGRTDSVFFQKSLFLTFFQQLVPVNDSAFFHKNFQFRFQSKGRISGAFDTWNLDYVYLNKDRNINDVSSKDYAWSQINSTLLKNYYAMPLRQFLVNPAANLTDTLKADVFNLSTSAAEARQFNYSMKIKDTFSGKIYQNFTLDNQNIILLPRTRRTIGVKTNLAAISEKKVNLQFQFILNNTQDNINPLGLDLSGNDSISHFVVLDDYFAYDDGTAEVGADIDQRFGKVAVQFTLSKPDTISAVRMNFSAYFKNVAGRFFLLQIHESAGGKPGKMLLQKSVQIDTLGKTDANYFQEILLDQNLAIKDTFYVAWTKISEDVIAVGVDKNTPQFSNKIFYNTGSEWVKNTSVKGSLMVRPVIGSRSAASQKITATEEENLVNLVVFPNPTDGILHWNLPNIKQIKIFDLAGKEVLQKSIQLIDNQQLSLENLTDGIYFVNFLDGKKSYVRKIYLAK